MPRALLVSFGLGFLMAAPIGPMGLLCLRHALMRGMRACLLSALGISSGYALWTFVVIHGRFGVVQWMDEEGALLRGAVGLFLLCNGVHGLANPNRAIEEGATRDAGLAAFGATFFVVLANPATLLMFSAMFALFGFADAHFDALQAFEVAAAVFGGAIAFWIGLSTAVTRRRRSLGPAAVHSLARATSSAIVALGVAILWSAVQADPARTMHEKVAAGSLDATLTSESREARVAPAHPRVGSMPVESVGSTTPLSLPSSNQRLGTSLVPTHP
jgi:threonine/homoserine/homoserine lactone efflux protein